MSEDLPLKFSDFEMGVESQNDGYTEEEVKLMKSVLALTSMLVAAGELEPMRVVPVFKRILDTFIKAENFMNGKEVK